MKLFIIVVLSLNLCCWARRYPYNDRRGRYYCPPIHEPTCASNGLNYVYFENQCNLDVRNYQEKRLGNQEYIECPLNNCYPKCKTCLAIDDPVCVIDGRNQQLLQFKNPCEVEFVACSFNKYYRFLNHGLCPKQNECFTTICSQDYRPICVNANSLYREFFNDCELQRSLCATNMKWQTVQAGPCFDNRAQDHGYRQEILEPICASSKNENRTFQSYYQLQTEMEKTGKFWSTLHTGYCPDQRPCRGEIIKPICAKLNTTTIKNFLSPCHLQEEKTKTGENWVILYQGVCRTSSTSYSNSRNVVETTTEEGATSVLAEENVHAESTTSTDKSEPLATTGVENRNGSVNTTPKCTPETPNSNSDNDEINPVQDETTKPTETTEGMSDEGIGKKTETSDKSIDNQSSATSSISNKDNELELGILSDAVNPDDGQDLFKNPINSENTSTTSDRRDNIETTTEKVNNETSTDQSGGESSANGNQSSLDKFFDSVTPKQETANLEVSSFSTATPNPEISSGIDRNLDQGTINENSNTSGSTGNKLPNRFESNRRISGSDINDNSVIPTETESDTNGSPSSSSNFSNENSDKNSEINQTPSQGDVKENEITQNQESINENSGNSGSSGNIDFSIQGTNNESASPSGNFRRDVNEILQNTTAGQDSNPNGVDAIFEKANDREGITETKNGISTQSQNDRSISGNSGNSGSSDQIIENATPTVNVGVDKLVTISDQTENPALFQQNTAADQSSGLDSVETLSGDSKEIQEKLIETLHTLLDMVIFKDDADENNKIPGKEADKENTTSPVLTVSSDTSSVKHEGNDDPSFVGNFSNNGISSQGSESGESNTSGRFENNENMRIESDDTGNRTLTEVNNNGNSNKFGSPENSDNKVGRNASINFVSVINDSSVEAAPSSVIKIKELVKKLGIIRNFVNRDNVTIPEIFIGMNETARQEVDIEDLNSPESTANNETASNGEATAGSTDSSNNEIPDLNSSNESPINTASLKSNMTPNQGANNATINPGNQEVENKNTNTSNNTETQNQESNIKQLNTLGNSGLNETSALEDGNGDSIINGSSGNKGLRTQVSQIPDTSISISGNITLSQEINRSSLNTSENTDNTHFSNLGSEIGNQNPLDNIGVTDVTSDCLSLDSATESSVGKQDETTENLENTKPFLDFGFLSDAVSPAEHFSNASDTHGNNTSSSQGVGNINQNITGLESNKNFAVQTKLTNNTRSSLRKNNPSSSTNTHRVIYNGAVYTAPASYSPIFNIFTLPNGNNHKSPINPDEFWSILPSNFTAYFGQPHIKPQILPQHQLHNKHNVKIKQPFKSPSYKIGVPYQHHKHNVKIEQPFKPPSHEIRVPYQHPRHNVEIKQPFKHSSHEIGVPYLHPKPNVDIEQPFNHASHEIALPYQHPNPNVKTEQPFKHPSHELVLPYQHLKPNVEIERPFKHPSHELGVPYQHPKPNVEIERPFKHPSHELGVPYQHPKPNLEIEQTSREIGAPYNSPLLYPLINNPYYDTHMPVATTDEEHQLPAELFPDSIHNSSPVDHPSISHSAPVSFPHFDFNYYLENLDLDDLDLEELKLVLLSYD